MPKDQLSGEDYIVIVLAVIAFVIICAHASACVPDTSKSTLTCEQPRFDHPEELALASSSLCLRWVVHTNGN